MNCTSIIKLTLRVKKRNNYMYNILILVCVNIEIVKNCRFMTCLI